MKGSVSVSVCVLHQWPLHCVTFFDGRPFSSCERGERIQKQHSVAQIEKGTASNHRLDVPTLSAQQGRALHAARSVVCFLTQPPVCRLRSVSPSGGITGRRARSHITLRGVEAASQASEYLLFLHFHPEATELSRETLEGA